jgi:hypothetical protein
MKKNRYDEEPTERNLASAYLRQPVPEPSERWHRNVMQAVRSQGNTLSIAPLRLETRMAWRAACVAAAAAAIMTILGSRVIPSNAALAWQFQHENEASAWILELGE